jgi:hypothetical protein
MSGNNIATGQIVNHTSYDLVVVNSGINSGHWNQTPVNIAATKTNNSAFVAQGASGSATGTSGWVQYSLSGTSALVTVAFDDPYSSSNSAGGTTSSNGGVSVVPTFPSSGSNVCFIYTVSGTPS